jgi:hypothetical protein
MAVVKPSLDSLINGVSQNKMNYKFRFPCEIENFIASSEICHLDTATIIIFDPTEIPIGISVGSNIIIVAVSR